MFLDIKINLLLTIMYDNHNVENKFIKNKFI